MKLIRNTVLATVGGVLLTGCNAFKDDLPECQTVINFTYTMNMDFEDQFAQSVHCLDLYIFKVTEGTKAEGSKHTTLLPEFNTSIDNNDLIKNGGFSVSLKLDEGEYQAVVYGGMACSEASFALTNLMNTDDDISVEDLAVALNKDLYFDGSDDTPNYDDDIDRSNLELHNHFYGTTSFTVNAQGNSNTPAVTVDLMRNTNTINLYVVDKDRYSLDAANYHFFILDDNNTMNHENMLTTSGEIAYRPYFKDNVTHDIEGSTYFGWPAAKASFTVSKLSANRNPQIIICNKNYNVLENGTKDLLPILKKSMDQDDRTSNMDNPNSFQEYLNRQNEWSITAEIDVVKNTVLGITIKVRDWEVRIDNIEVF